MPAPWRPVRALAVVRVYVPAAAAWLVATIAYLRAMAALGSPVSMQPALGLLATMDWGDARLWQFAAAIVVAAPLAEELVFRGYLLTALQRGLPPHLANAVTALLFGALHGLEYLLPTAVLGFLFGWLRQEHGSIAPSILAHVLHNALTMVVALQAPQALDWMYAR
jgi:membrane protease YdiL (CAAX protease family)